MDGQIARSFPSQRSMFGTMLDPVADKLLIGTLFITLSYVELIPCEFFIISQFDISPLFESLDALTGIVFLRDFLLLFGAFRHRYLTLEPPRTLKRYFNPSVSSIEIQPTFISKVSCSLN